MEGRKKMNVPAYLDRLGLDRGVLSPDADSLRLLQRSHLLSVPFENLDIHWRRPIVLDLDRFYEKIVVQGRGGFCYELNGLFDELLRELGFETRLISARVFNGTSHGPEYDHMAISVTFGEGDSEEMYLADVGFGAFSAEPLLFVLGVEQRDRSGIFLLTHRVDGYYEILKQAGDDWQSEYIFSGNEKTLAEFAEMCDFQQYSPESHFTKGKLCSIMTENGRKTLSDSKFIITAGSEKTEIAVEGEAHFYRVLNDEFGIERIQ